MPRRIPIVLAAVLVMLFVLPPPCSACSCVQMTREEMLDNAQLVFRGRVIQQGSSHAVIRVDTLWKGRLSSSTVKVWRGDGPGDCGIPFLEGSTYVVLAHERSGSDVLDTGTCSGTGLVSAMQVVATLGDGEPVAGQPGQADTQESDAAIWTWVAVVGSAGVVFGVLVWRRRMLMTG